MSSKIKTFTFKDFSKGFNRDLLRSEISSNELYSVINMYAKKDKIVTRNGLKKLSSYAIYDNTEGYSLKKLGGVIHSGEKAIKLILASRQNDGNFYNKLVIVNSDARCEIVDLFNCNANDYSSTVSAVNCFSFSGKAIKGSGVFIVIGVIDNQNAVCDKIIYELNESLNAIVEILPSEIYAPLVLVNGRGESYSKLSTAERNFASPQILEDFNMLSSAFCAAYKTDGQSGEFYLPTKKLSAKENENIIITYTDYLGIEHTASVPYNSNYSETITINGESYKYKVNRDKGEIMIVDSADALKALPMVSGIENNLIIKAYKAPKSDRIFKMSITECLNSRVFLSGNADEGNLICFSKCNNPLYFPESNIAYFGDKTSAVTAIKQQNDRLIVFKPNEIGICSAVKSSEYNLDLILLGKVNRASTLESMTVKSINSGIGCIMPETLVNCANRLVFYGTDKKVYTITSSSNYLQRIYHISRKVDNSINTSFVYNNVFAIDYDGKYMLFLGNKCFLFDYEISGFFSGNTVGANQKDDIAWYCFIYNLGEADLFSSLCVNKKAVLLGYYSTDDGVRRINCYTIDGKKDSRMTDESNFEEDEIKSSFETCVSDFGEDRKKQIVGIEVILGKECSQSSGAITVSYFNENLKKVNSTINFNDEDGNQEVPNIRSVCIFGARYFGLEFSRVGTFSVKSIKVRYK